MSDRQDLDWISDMKEAIARVLEAAGLEGLLEILHRHDAIATDIDAALERHVLRHMGTA
jgi:hypothetical protein